MCRHRGMGPVVLKQTGAQTVDSAAHKPDSSAIVPFIRFLQRRILAGSRTPEHPRCTYSLRITFGIGATKTTPPPPPLPHRNKTGLWLHILGILGQHQKKRARMNTMVHPVLGWSECRYLASPGAIREVHPFTRDQGPALELQA